MNPPSTLTLEDYEAIEQAVMETERGRWFLSEFARRNRVADTGEILNALSMLETRLSATRIAPPPPPADRMERIAPTLAKLADAASRLRLALDAPEEAEARVELAVSRVATLEKAIAAVRAVAAGVQVPPKPSAEPPAAPEAPSAPPAKSDARKDAEARRQARREARSLALEARASRAVLPAPTPPAAPPAPATAVETRPAPPIPQAWSRAAEERDLAAPRSAPLAQPKPPARLTSPALPGTLLESLSAIEKALLFA